VIAWPTAHLLGTVTAVALVACLAWTIAVWLGPWGADVAVAGLTGVGIVAVLTAASLLMLQPWKTRPISTWLNLWLAGTVMRLLAVPAVTFVLYSAAPLSAGALILGVGLTYVLTLLAEAAVLARHVGRAA
jgi:hypothetical protein